MGFLSKGIDSRGPGKGLKWKLEGQLQRSELLHGEDGRGHPNRDSYDVNLLPPTLSGEKLVEGSEGGFPSVSTHGSI